MNSTADTSLCPQLLPSDSEASCKEAIFLAIAIAEHPGRKHPVRKRSSLFHLPLAIIARWSQRVSCAFLIFLACASLASLSGAADSPKSIVDLQPFRTTTSIRIRDAGGKEGLATLINLNPAINSWYLLRLNWGGGAPEEAYHLQNARPRTQTLLLEETSPNGLAIVRGKERSRCDLWGADVREGLKDARKSALPYAPLCGGGIYLRNPTKGHQSPIEKVTDLLREKVPGGEEVVSFVRDTFFARLYQKKAEEKVESKPAEGQQQRKADKGPASALVNPDQASRVLKAIDLGIEIEDSGANNMTPGAWYAAKDNPGIYVSVIVPDGIAPEILRSYPKRVNGLDSVESGQLVYLIAFDLKQFNLHYSVGTAHPGVGWSGHIPGQMKDKSLPGPDGIDTSAPLVRTGLINPMDAPRTVATFTGGFKRVSRGVQVRTSRRQEPRHPLWVLRRRRPVQHASTWTLHDLCAQ